MPIDIPDHVAIRRRDGRREVLLHRSMAVIGDDKIEIKSARGTVILPIIGLLLASTAVTWMARSGSSLPFWALVTMLLVSLILVPFSTIALISAVIGADVVVDAKKGSATWQQGFLGMGIGTKELVPFAKIDHLEVGIEGDQPDRWRGEADAIRQFSLTLVKKSGKRLSLANVPVPAYGQADGMDRTLAVGNAVAQLTGSTVTLPEGWELVEIDTRTGSPVPPKAAAAAKPAAARRKRGRRTRNA
ncbi:MAG: hypothetical protein ABIQ47_00685 [Tepidiformaceae bacterium]